MKKPIILAAFVLMAIASQAQVRVGIRGGFNASNYARTDDITDTTTVANSTLGSFNVGLVLDMPFSKNFSLQPGLIVSGKGAKQEYNSSGFRSEGKINPMYLEIPVNLLFRVDVAGIGIYANGGPYLGFGIGGKKSFSISSGSVSGSDEGSIDYGSDRRNDDLEKTDFGFNLGAGIELFKTFSVGLNYGVGLKNVIPGNPSSKLYNRVLSLNATLLLGKVRD